MMDAHCNRDVATLADKVGAALREFAAAALGGVSPDGSDQARAEPTRLSGRRQQEIVEVEQLAAQDGLKVAEISKALGGYDVANTHLALRSLEKKGAVEMVPESAPQRWRLTAPYMDRRRVWDREELILALDCYVRNGGEVAQAEIEELRRDLSFWALERHECGRSTGSVGYKLANFRAIDTNYTEGFPHVGRRDTEVYDEFATKPEALRQAASEIIRRLEAEDASEEGRSPQPPGAPVLPSAAPDAELAAAAVAAGRGKGLGVAFAPKREEGHATWVLRLETERGTAEYAPTLDQDWTSVLGDLGLVNGA
jgi:hypothetical protein